MGRRAVVIESPGSRRPVVLREGPPQREPRRIADVIAAIVGAILLIGAIVLVNALPQDDPLPDQYQVTYERVAAEDPVAQTLQVAEGATGEYAFEVPGEYVYRIEVAVEWIDDVASSLPDEFQIRLSGPGGDTGLLNFSNPQPVDAGNALAPTYQARPLSRVLSVDIDTRPTTTVLSAERDESEAEVTARAEADARTNATGTWTLTATLVDAGDCPDGSTLDLARAAGCLTETGGASDDGNPFQVVLVTIISYPPSTALLGEQS